MVERDHAAHFVAPGEGQVLEVLGDRFIFYLDSEDTGGTHALIEEITPPGGGPPVHVHENEDETLFILDGDYEMTCGEAMFKAGAGGVVFLPRRIPHTFRVVGDAPGRMLVVMTPGGFERFFRRLHQQSPDEDLPMDKVATIAAEFGVRFVED